MYNDEAKAAYATANASIAGSTAQNNAVSGGLYAGVMASASQGTMTSVDTAIDNYFGLKALSANSTSLLSNAGSTDYNGTKNGSGSSGSNSAEKQISESLLLKDRYFSLNQELLKTQNLLDVNKSLQSNTVETDNMDEKIKLQKKKITLQKEEISLLQQKQVAEKNIENEQAKERAEITKALTSKGVNFSGQNPTNADTILQSKLDAVNAHRNDKDKTQYNTLKTTYDDYNTSLTRFFTLQNTEIPKTKAEYQDLAISINKVTTEIKKEKEELETLNLDNLNKSFEKSIANSDTLISNLENSSKFNFKQDDNIGQLEILHQKESIYQDDITKDKAYLDELSKTIETTVVGQDALDSAIAKGTETLKGHTTALLDNKQAEEDMAKTMITTLIESQKASAEITLKQQQENEKNSLASSIYGGSGTSDAIIKAYDTQNQVSQDYYQKQIDNLNTVNELQQEIETKLKNENDLTEKQTALQTAQRNLTTKVDVQNADGTWGFKMVADASTVQTAQKAVDDQIISNNAYLKSIDLKHTTESLNASKKALADQKTAKDKAYSDQLSILETTQLKETNLLQLHYVDMTATAKLALDGLVKLYGDDWGKIIKQLTADTATAKALQNSLALAQANGTLASQVTGGVPSGGGIGTTATTGGVSIGSQSWTNEQINNPSNQEAIRQAVVSGQTITVTPAEKGGFVDTNGSGMDGKGGSMLMVHPKELVVDKLNSSTLLNIQDMQKNIMRMNMPNFNTPTFNNNNSSTPTVNHYHNSYGDLSFPNAIKSDEILTAMKSLPSAMKQKSS